MSSASTTEMSRITKEQYGYGTFEEFDGSDCTSLYVSEGSDHEYEPSRCRSRCYKLAEVSSTLAVPIVTALSWYFLAHDCEGESTSNCIKEEMPTFLLATTGSIYTGIKLINGAINCRRELPNSEEALLNS